MTLDLSALYERDAQGYQVIEALTPTGSRSSSTHARPVSYVCLDGKTYWVKGNAQNGLVAELIAGRLAAKIGAGPLSRIIRVPDHVAVGAAATGDPEGLLVGSEDVPGTMNSKELGSVVQNRTFDPKVVDAASRARVITFHTWIGVGDAQSLVGLTNGIASSIDHGGAFPDPLPRGTPGPIVAPIPGVSDSVGRSRDLILSAVGRIEQLTDDELLDVISCVPSGDSWQSDPSRRLEIGSWLAGRRDQLRLVMEAWL